MFDCVVWLMIGSCLVFFFCVLMVFFLLGVRFSRVIVFFHAVDGYVVQQRDESRVVDMVNRKKRSAGNK